MKLILLILSFLIITAQLSADIPNPLQVACIPNLYPVSFLNDEGKPDGAFPRVIEEIARKNNIEIEWSIDSWAGNLEKIRNGDIDLMIALVFTPERDSFLDYSNQFVLSTWSQIFQKEEGLIDSILDVEGKRIGMVREDQNARAFVDLADSFNIKYRAVILDSFDEIYNDLNDEKIDAGVFYNLYSLSHPDLIPTSIIYQPTHSYFAIPEGADNQILKLIDQTLSDWKSDSNSFYFQKIVTLVSGDIPPPFPQWMKYIFPGLVALLLYILFWSWLLKKQVHQRTAALLNAQEGYRSTFTEADVGIFHVNAAGLFLRVNPGFCKNLGYSDQILLKMNITDVVSPEDVAKDKALFQEIIDGRVPSYRTELRYISKNGGILWGHLTLSAVRSTDGSLRYLVGITEDITARKNAEYMVDDLQKRYRGTFENSYQMTALFDNMGGLLDINNTLKQLIGIKDEKQKLLGMTPSDIEMFGPIGSLRIQEMVDDCLSTGQIIRHVIGFEETSGKFAVDVTVKPIFTEDGQIKYCISEAHDITDIMNLTNSLELQVEERTHDIQDAQDKLIEAEKMASLGRLVAGIAHEINTPVGVAKTGVSFLTEQVEDTQRKFEEQKLSKDEFSSFLSSLAELSGILEQNLDRAIKLIRDFKMTSADQSSHEMREVPIKEYMEAVMHSLSPRFKNRNISWTIKAPVEKQSVHVGVINQLLLNMSINALTHAFLPEEKGQITIEYYSDKGKRILNFSDDGCGIPDEMQNRIFEPFFTTGRGKGNTGLGLSIIYNLVTEVLQGDIECTSSVGKGTTFRISCPESK
ncbi:MAG: PAS domain S-box protein [Spirochaetaceae bacterium]|nr:PAS domain S-box protein [Spirochaetaceae bacterium]